MKTTELDLQTFHTKGLTVFHRTVLPFLRARERSARSSIPLRGNCGEDEEVRLGKRSPTSPESVADYGSARWVRSWA